MKPFLSIAVGAVLFAACNTNGPAINSAVASNQVGKARYTCETEIAQGPHQTPIKNDGSFELSADKDIVSKKIDVGNGDSYLLMLDRTGKAADGITPLALRIISLSRDNNSAAAAEDGSKLLVGSLNLAVSNQNALQIRTTCFKK